MHGNKPVTWFYLRVIPAQGELQDEDTLHRSFGKRLAHHQQPCTLPTHCQCKSFRECPAAGGGLPTPPQARGEALTHWCPPGMLANCCPPPPKDEMPTGRDLPSPRDLCFSSGLNQPPFSGFTPGKDLNLRPPAPHGTAAKAASHTAVKSSSYLAKVGRKRVKGGRAWWEEGRRKPGWKKEHKLAVITWGNRMSQGGQMPTLFPHPNAMLSRLPTPLRFVFIFNKCKKFPKATLYWQI